MPEGWAWCRLKHVCTMAAGKAKPTDQIMTEPFEGCYPCFGGNGIRGYVDEYNQDGIFSIVANTGNHQSYYLYLHQQQKGYILNHTIRSPVQWK